MPNLSNITNHLPLMQAVKNFIGKLRQSPDVYPIKYYKKNKRLVRKASFVL